MASVRARRMARPEPPRRGRRAPPAPSFEGMPRLARIKLSGGLTSNDVPVTGKNLMVGLASLVLFLGAGIAVAAWLGSSLFDAREAVARAADAAAVSVGFEVDEIEISGVGGARAAEIRELVVPEGRRSLLAVDPLGVKERLESLDWVKSVNVRRLWPSTLAIEVERRREFALWEEDGQVSVIDLNGERLLAERPEDHLGLPRVVGAGAGPAAEPLLAALEGLPEVRDRLRQLVRVNDRRWNLELVSGALVALPESDAPRALARLETLHREHALLDRPLTSIDMRAPGRIAVRVHPALAGGRRDDQLGGV